MGTILATFAAFLIEIIITVWFMVVVYRCMIYFDDLKASKYQQLPNHAV